MRCTMYKLYILIAGMFIFTVSCTGSNPGVVRASKGNPILTIEAGDAILMGGTILEILYVIDTATETCWIKIGTAASKLNCCDLYKVKKARVLIKWVNSLKCGKKHGDDSREPNPLAE